MAFVQNKRLGLALGGGGSRGLAHLGVLQVLEEAGLRWHAITGASVGSFVGAFVAACVGLEELHRLSRRVRWWHLVHPAWPRRGLFSMAPLERFLRRRLGDLCLEDLPLPYACVATNALTGQTTVFDSGPLAPRVHASCAIPGVIRPVEIDGVVYVDGGMVDNLPIRPLRRMGAEVILAVNLFGPPSHLPTGIATFSLTIIGHTLVQAGCDPGLADVLVEPDLTGKGIIRLRFDDYMARGRAAMQAKLPELLRALGEEPKGMNADDAEERRFAQISS